MGGDVLPELPGRHDVPDGPELVEQLVVDEVDLAHVRGARVGSHSAAVLDGHAAVRIPFHAEPFEQRDRIEGLFGEPVVGADMD
ncbi:hypothetical protein GCM10027030_19170 [Luteococcus sediminum]